MMTHILLSQYKKPTMPLQILLTGFGPFGNVVDNPTERLLRHFEGQTHSGLELTTCALPTSFGRGPQAFKAALEAGGRDGQSFDVVLMLGVAAGSYAWRVETQGLNWDDPRIPDVDGFSTPGRTIVDGSPAQLPSTLSPSLLAQAIETVGVPVILSNSAGAYLCNHLLYIALHHVQASGHPAQVGFLHIPADEHTYALDATTPSVCTFPFAQHVDVIRAVLSYVAQYAGRD